MSIAVVYCWQGKRMDEPVFQESPFGQPSRRRSRIKRFLLLLIVLLILGGIGFGGFTIFRVSTSPKLSPTPIPTAIIFPSDTPTPEVSEEPTKPAATPTKAAAKTTSSIDRTTGLDRAKLTIQVQNGSGKTGVANSAATELKNLGYIVLGTVNADNFNYENVTILVKPAKSSYLSLLKKDLSSSYSIGDTASTLASSSADAVVIIGK